MGVLGRDSDLRGVVVCIRRSMILYSLAKEGDLPVTIPKCRQEVDMIR